MDITKLPDARLRINETIDTPLPVTISNGTQPTDQTEDQEVINVASELPEYHEVLKYVGKPAVILFTVTPSKWEFEVDDDLVVFEKDRTVTPHSKEIVPREGVTLELKFDNNSMASWKIEIAPSSELDDKLYVLTKNNQQDNLTEMVSAREQFLQLLDKYADNASALLDLREFTNLLLYWAVFEVPDQHRELTWGSSRDEIQAQLDMVMASPMIADDKAILDAILSWTKEQRGEVGYDLVFDYTQQVKTKLSNHSHSHELGAGAKRFIENLHERFRS